MDAAGKAYQGKIPLIRGFDWGKYCPFLLLSLLFRNAHILFAPIFAKARF